MKKVLLTSALFLSVCALSAQESVVKQAKSESDPVKAAKIIAPALKDPSTANNPETWKIAGDIQKKIYDEAMAPKFLTSVSPSSMMSNGFLPCSNKKGTISSVRW